jgi:hypothetical protein
VSFIRIISKKIGGDNYKVKIAQFLLYKNHKELSRNEQQAFESLTFFRKN